MTKTDEILIKKARLAKLASSPKTLKSGGVYRKVTRQVRNLEK